MAKKKATKNSALKGEQGMLMEVGPEGMEKIRPFVVKCDKAQAARKREWDKVIDAKENIAELVKAENLNPAPNGKITFKCDGVTVVVTPQKDKVEVKEEKEES